MMPELLQKACNALQKRTYFRLFSETPAAYSPDQAKEGYAQYEALLQQPLAGLVTEQFTAAVTWVEAAETSAFHHTPLAVGYPNMPAELLLEQAYQSQIEDSWQSQTLNQRQQLLCQLLHDSQPLLFSVAYALQHTTGQAFGLAFQTHTHAINRALEALALAQNYHSALPETAYWQKDESLPVQIQKSYLLIPKGIALVVADALSPLSALPAILANLALGNTTLVFAHTLSTLPLAIWVKHMRQGLQQAGYSPDQIQLVSPHTPLEALYTSPYIALIDWLRTDTPPAIPSHQPTLLQPSAALHAILLHSANDLRQTIRNIAYAALLHSGQMPHSPKIICIAETGVSSYQENIDYSEVVELLRNELSSIALNPKAGALLMGALQTDESLNQLRHVLATASRVLLSPLPMRPHPHYPQARIASPALVEVSPEGWDKAIYSIAAPLLTVVKTKDLEESLTFIAQQIPVGKTAMTTAYIQLPSIQQRVVNALNRHRISVHLNFSGYNFSLQTAAFSDTDGLWGTLADISSRCYWLTNRQQV